MSTKTFIVGVLVLLAIMADTTPDWTWLLFFGLVFVYYLLGRKECTNRLR